MLYPIASIDITSRHITSRHMTSYHITSHHITGKGSRSVCGAVSWVQVRGDARPRMVTRSPLTKPRAALRGSKNQTCKCPVLSFSVLQYSTILSYPTLPCPLLPFLGCVPFNHATQLSLPGTWHFLFPRRSFTPLLSRHYDTLVIGLSSVNYSSSSTFLLHLHLLYFQHLFFSLLFSSHIFPGPIPRGLGGRLLPINEVVRVRSVRSG